MSIADTRLSEFLPYVIPHCPACPDPVAEFLLRQAAIEFCERTRCWRYVTSVEITAATVDLPALANTEVDEIEEATHNGVRLSPTTYLESLPVGLYGAQADAAPKWITQVGPGSMIVSPFLAGTLRLSLILKPQSGVAMGFDPDDPLRDAKNVVPAFILSHHAATIAAGALARILMLPGQPFTEPGMAAVKRAEFDAATNSLAAKFQKGQQRAPLRTTARWM